MNTIPSIFNEHQIQRTVLGGTEMVPNAVLPISLIILNREGSRYRSQMLLSLLKNGFESIVSIESSAENYNIDDLVQRFPQVKFIIPLEKITTGDMINIGMSEVTSRYVLVLWDNIHVSPTLLSSRIAEKLTERNAFCIAPQLITENRQTIPVHMSPAVEKYSFRVLPSTTILEGSPTVYPYDFMGIYDRQKFIQLGGYDYTIKSSYWQNLDLSLRAWLWNEQILLSPIFRLIYEGTAPVEETTINESHIRFYLKNLAPRFTSDHAYIPISKFFGFQKNSSLGFFEAKKQFNDARRWVEKNKFRYHSDVQNLIENWERTEI